MKSPFSVKKLFALRLILLRAVGIIVVQLLQGVAKKVIPCRILQNCKQPLRIFG